MTKSRVDELFGRALTNRGFRTRLLADPLAALDGYELTDEERRQVLMWTADTFDELIRNLEARIERARFDGVGFQPAENSASGCRAGLKAGPYEDPLRGGRPYEDPLRSGRPSGRPEAASELSPALTPSALSRLMASVLPELAQAPDRHHVRSSHRSPDRDGSAWVDEAAALAATLHEPKPSSSASDSSRRGAEARDETSDSDARALVAREAHLRDARIVRQVGESVVQCGDVRLHCCSVLHGGSYSDEQFVSPSVCGGRGLTADLARAGAISEAAERVAGAVYDDRAFVLDCFRTLAADAVAPSSFALFSAAQHAEPDFPYAPFTESTRVNWTWGYSLLQRRRVLVPAAFVYRPYWPGGHEARLADLPTTGLACGRSLVEATLNGLYEVIERDAIVIAWLNRLAVPQVDMAGSMWTESASAPGSGRAISLHDITTDLDIPARLAIVSDRSAGIVSVGAAAQLDPREAADRAVAEALMIEPVVRSMMSRRPPQSPARREDVRTLEDHLLFYCDRERMRELDFLLDAPGRVSGDVDTQRSRGHLDDLRTVVRSLQQHSLDAVVVDVTLPEIAAAGLRVVRTIVPGLIPLTFGERFAAKGGERLYQVPVRLGHRAVPLREDQLNPTPHPFA